MGRTISQHCHKNYWMSRGLPAILIPYQFFCNLLVNSNALFSYYSNKRHAMSSQDESPTAGEDERKLKRRQSLESQVNSGLGSKKKKQQNVEAFYSSVWPILESAGWTLVSVM